MYCVIALPLSTHAAVLIDLYMHTPPALSLQTFHLHVYHFCIRVMGHCMAIQTGLLRTAAFVCTKIAIFINTWKVLSTALQAIYVCVFRFTVTVGDCCTIHHIANFPFELHNSLTVYGCLCWSSQRENQLIKCSFVVGMAAPYWTCQISPNSAHAIKPKATEFLPKTVGRWFHIYMYLYLSWCRLGQLVCQHS